MITFYKPGTLCRITLAR